MKDLHSTEKPKLTCVLIGVASKQQETEQVMEYLDELEFLARTYDLDTVRVFTQRLDKPDKSTYIGKGKVEEISAYVKENKVDVLIFDDEISPSQQRNLEKVFGKKILDRTTLIL